jgi:hypothetical protein
MGKQVEVSVPQRCEAFADRYSNVKPQGIVSLGHASL